MALAPGSSLGPYEIIALLGAGGMGEVYRARDPRLNRDVAIKVLPADRLADEARRRWFVQEAQSASALNHPHIVTIYEVGEEEGRPFIAMEHVQGRPLSDLIPRDGLASETVLRYGIQVADAVAHAHDRGIVHRDLKSANVMITPEARAKVLDFGLAVRHGGEELMAVTHSRVSLAEVGVVAGTLAYMAPEVLRGEPADSRSDLWALGTLLYEMTAGEMPFKGNTGSELSSAILHDAPEPLPSQASAALRAVILRCLAKDPTQRYQRTAEVRAALEAIQSGTMTTIPRPRRLPRRWILAAGCVLALIAAASLYVVGHNSEISSIAVLPFANTSGDVNTEYVSDGITESLINNLSQAPRLSVRPRSSVFRYKRRDLDPQAAGRELGVEGVITGRIGVHDNSLSISAELIDLRSDRQIWGEHYSRAMADLLAVQEEISQEIAQQLRQRLSGEERKRLIRRYTDNSAAYQLYLEGRYYWNKRTEQGFRRGIEHFQQAINTDPSYALAYSGLADSYIGLGYYTFIQPREAMPQAEAAAAKALEVDEALAEAHTSLAHIKMNYDWDWGRAEREFKRAIELDPRYATAHHWYAVHYLTATGRLDEAIAEERRALQLDPLSLVMNSFLGATFYFGREYDQAIDQCRKSVDLDPSFSVAHWYLGLAYLQKSTFGEAISELQKAIQLSGDAPLIKAALGYAYARSGREAEARKILQELMRTSNDRYVSAFDIAAIHAGLGEKDQALEWLDKAAEERSFHLVYLKVWPQFDLLRTDRRFQDLVRRIGLTP